MSNQQIKSKDRIVNHGEVYTADREVQAMCDLVANSINNIYSKVLEPSCGNGNFLVEILTRKLKVILQNQVRDLKTYEYHSFIALSSLYGIDILEDNIQEARERLFNIWYEWFNDTNNCHPNADLVATIKVILDKNLVVGDGIKMQTLKGNSIAFYEWNLDSSHSLKYTKYEYAYLVDDSIRNEIIRKNSSDSIQLSLFNEFDKTSDYEKYLNYDSNSKEFTAIPLKTKTIDNYQNLYKLWKIKKL